MQAEIHIHTAAPSRGWGWIADGFQLFRQQKWPWVGMSLLYVLIWVGMSMLQSFGQVLLSSSMPLFVAGFLLAAQKRSLDQSISVADLFLGWRLHFRPLAGYCLFLLPISIVSEYIAQNLLQSHGVQHTLLIAAEIALLLFGLLCSFIPALLIFNGVGFWQALSLSVHAVLRNWQPMLLSLLAFVLLGLLTLLTLGLAFLVLFPVMYLALFLSWREIFGAEAA
ncbi:hypothetical protein BI343_05430 [Chromobacterium amazonense]|uniref:BPSS1780 family membrane protein n=1 Tax=Chromobacterium amazonense TaxID=1382803 RepID=UPI0008D9DDCF|nr:BPSS1780 family membrane protein [Chromobacterium amazonense]OHX11022.1 hypothetical protein BI343_05430 [Chromobacterium amazonense]